jgi:hypothetical protein
MVALCAAAIECERIAAVGRADLVKPLRYFSDCGVPVDRLEGAVGAPAQRSRQAVGLVLVIVKPLSFLAGVSFRLRVRLIAAAP